MVHLCPVRKLSEQMLNGNSLNMAASMERWVKEHYYNSFE